MTGNIQKKSERIVINSHLHHHYYDPVNEPNCASLSHMLRRRNVPGCICGSVLGLMLTTFVEQFSLMVFLEKKHLQQRQHHHQHHQRRPTFVSMHQQYQNKRKQKQAQYIIHRELVQCHFLFSLGAACLRGVGSHHHRHHHAAKGAGDSNCTDDEDGRCGDEDDYFWMQRTKCATTSNTAIVATTTSTSAAGKNKQRHHQFDLE